jgi:CMP-N-acetylneuraminic acid synthetase
MRNATTYVTAIEFSRKSELADSVSEAEHRRATLSDLFSNPIFGNTAISLSATAGLLN